MLLISVLLTFKGISQIASNDSITCLPNTQLKKAINLIEQGKVVKQELDATKSKVIVLDSLILIKDKIIVEQNKKNIYSESVILGYKSVVENLQKSISNSELAFDLQKKKYKREKFKKWGTLAVGVLIGTFLIK